jgi:ATP-dependent RNA helicase DDX24/MAK5
MTDEEAEEIFHKEYMKMGGIQHIIASATMTIDNKGRMTPRKTAIEKRKNAKHEEVS